MADRKYILKGAYLDGYENAKHYPGDKFYENPSYNPKDPEREAAYRKGYKDAKKEYA